MRRLLAAILTIIPLTAYGQVQQSGSVTPGHVTSWTTSGVVQDGGTASNGKISSLGLYGNGGTPFCITNSSSPGPFSGNYSQLCMGVSQTAGYLQLNSYNGSSSLPFNFIINGTTIPVTSGFVSMISGSAPITTVTSSGTATIGITLDGNFVVNNSNALALSNIPNGYLLANSSGTSAEPSSTTLTSILDADISSTQGSIIYRNASKWISIPPGTSGQVFQTQGVGANPIWGTVTGVGTVTSVATNNGLTGGTITSSGTIGLAAIGGGQILSNSTTSSNAPSGTASPVLGIPGTTSGSVGIANGGGAGTTVTIQNPASTSPYNFNVPASAGLIGQAIISNGGALSAMGWTNIPSPIRQTVLSGSTTSGQASFLSAGTGLSINLSATAVPITETTANGFGQTGSSDTYTIISSDVTGAWTGLTANSTLFLYIDTTTPSSPTYGFSPLVPVYAYIAPASPSTDQHWFDLTSFQMKRWNGSVWASIQRCFVGEAITGASSVTSVITYAIQGQYDSGLFQVSPVTPYTKNHNIGIPSILTLTLSDDSSGTNERTVPTIESFSTTAYRYAGTATRNSVQIVTGASYVGTSVTESNLTSAYYRYRVKRGF